MRYAALSAVPSGQVSAPQRPSLAPSLPPLLSYSRPLPHPMPKKHLPRPDVEIVLSKKMGSKIHEAPLERAWMEEDDSEIQTCSHLLVPCAATEGRSLRDRRPGLARPSATHVRACPTPSGSWVRANTGLLPSCSLAFLPAQP